MQVTKFKEYEIKQDELTAVFFEAKAAENPAKRTSGIVQETLGFTRMFEDFSTSGGARYFEYIGGLFVAKILHETRIPNNRDIDRELIKRKQEFRKAEPDTPLTRRKISELRKQCKEDLRAVTAPRVDIYYIIINAEKPIAYLNVSNSKKSETLLLFLGQAGIHLMECDYSINIEDDLLEMLSEPETRLPEDWNLGNAVNLKNIADNSQASYAKQNLESNELNANVDNSKRPTDLEVIYHDFIRCRLTSNQAVTNIKLLARELPDGIDFSSESGESQHEIDVLRSEWSFTLFIIQLLSEKVRELYENSDQFVVSKTFEKENQLEFTTTH
jgi:DNA recombination-dependent growth factor C